jgi:hypothetical protein
MHIVIYHNPLGKGYTRVIEKNHEIDRTWPVDSQNPSGYGDLIRIEELTREHEKQEKHFFYHICHLSKMLPQLRLANAIICSSKKNATHPLDFRFVNARVKSYHDD